MKVTENNFVEQMKKRNEQALVYVVEQYGWVLKTVVKRQMQTLPYLWDDCMNDTLMAVWENIESFDPKRTEFQNWLAGVCRFKALTYVRKYISASREEPVEQMPEWEDENAGLSMDEVAKEMNMSKTVIYGRISRGKKQLRQIAGEGEV